MSDYHRTQRTAAFRHDFVLPADTSRMAVSYDGTIGERTSGFKQFWRVP